LSSAAPDETKVATLALRAADRDRLFSAWESSPFGLVVLNAEGYSTYENEAFRSLTGYEAEELARLPVSSYTHPEDAEEAASSLRRLLDGAITSYRLETRLLRKDGGIVWADCYVTAIDDVQPTALVMVQDITSRKLSEALLDEQNVRLSRVVETRREIAIGDLGLDEVARLVAARAKELTGSDSATVSILDEGEPPLQVVIGEAETTADFCVPLLRRGKEVGSLSLAKEGGVTDDDQRILELLAILLGSVISDAAERAARRDQIEALNRFETIFEAAPIGIGLLSLDGRLESTNSAMRDITGRSAQELARRSTLGYTVPEDIDEVVRLFTGMVEGQYDSYRNELRLYAKDGEVVWVDAATALLRDADGKPRAAVAMAQNITKRRAAEEQSRESEARYRTLVEQLPLITHIDTPYSADQAAQYVSPQIEEILGYSIDEWHTSPAFFEEHLHPDDRDRVREAQREARDSAEPLELEYRFMAADGRVVWLKDSHTVVRDETGNPRYTQGFAIDVTAQKQGEEDREALLTHSQEQNERLRKLDRMKDEFIALVSHELRTPLTSICGYLELLLDDHLLAELPEAQLSWLEVIDRNAERLLRLVEDLLITAQADAGNLALEIGELDIAAIISQAVQASTPVATARGIALNSSTEPLPVADGDRLRIGQVIDNLVSNALKFTPAGGTIDVRAYSHRSAVRIAVTDTGMGIAESEQAQLFDRFFRTARAQDEAIPGVGLGLSISKAIVEAHDGRLSVSSVEGVGTTFFVDLPAAARPNWIVAA
jgi:PAS domain S-box-containing protein